MWVPYRKAIRREKKWDVRLFPQWVDKSVTHDYIAMAVEATQKQIVKFNESGRGLSRNDIRVILMGNVLAELSRIRNRDTARDLLREMEPGIEKRIEHRFSQTL